MQIQGITTTWLLSYLFISSVHAAILKISNVLITVVPVTFIKPQIVNRVEFKKFAS